MTVSLLLGIILFCQYYNCIKGLSGPLESLFSPFGHPYILPNSTARLCVRAAENMKPLRTVEF